MFKHYNHLGFNNPYYFDNNGKFEIQKNLPDIIKKYNSERKIDPVSIIELLNKNYMFADRTLIKGVQHTPWLAKPNAQLNDWIYDNAPKHGVLDMPEEEIATTLFQKICTEIESYIGKKKKVGVLLSGGMDSRMVAGALDYLIKTGTLSDCEVTGLTWGNEGTRDVVYAKEIACRVGWKWKHYTITAQDLLNNITETAIHGCEYSPIHLHAIPQIRDDNENMEVILAGSYGDSIGRAEYSGRKVRHIKPLLHNISNAGGFIHRAVYDSCLKKIEQDVYRYHQQFPEPEPYMQNELDYQLHYMRRMLNPCMALLTEKMEFYQIFTHPDVFGFMWSINPARRNDRVYAFMLKKFKTKLHDLPWARTGLPYGQKEGKPDRYGKKHHSYIDIIQTELFKEIENRILSDEIEALNIFNKKAIKTILKLIKLCALNNLFYLEKIIWLSSVAEMINIYNIKGVEQSKIIRTSLMKSIPSVSIEYLLRGAKYKFASYIKS